jgi:hypothetical protein
MVPTHAAAPAFTYYMQITGASQGQFNGGAGGSGAFAQTSKCFDVFFVAKATAKGQQSQRVTFSGGPKSVPTAPLPAGVNIAGASCAFDPSSAQLLQAWLNQESLTVVISMVAAGSTTATRTWTLTGAQLAEMSFVANKGKTSTSLSMSVNFTFSNIQDTGGSVTAGTTKPVLKPKSGTHHVTPKPSATGGTGGTAQPMETPMPNM